MKFLIVVVSLALFALSSAQLYPSPSVGCPNYCTEEYIPVCAMNRRCTAIIRNPCYKDIINCKTVRQEEIFYGVDMSNCIQAGLTRQNNIICRPN